MHKDAQRGDSVLTGSCCDETSIDVYHTGKMFTASPLWLLALLPWGAVVFYLIPGRGTPAAVPFITFWKNSAAVSRRRGRRLPSAPVFLALLAMLLAVLAAANPQIKTSTIGGDLSIILDRGATMAMPSASGEPYGGVFRKFTDRLGNLSALSRVTLVCLPGTIANLRGDNWMAAAKDLPATVLSVDLEQAIANQLRDTSGPVVVLSGQHLKQNGSRIIQIMPDPPADAVAIMAVSARASSHPQVMIRLENRSIRKTIHLTVRSESFSADSDVNLPLPGQSIDHFVDMAGLGESVSVELSPRSADDPWSGGFAVRRGAGIRIAVAPSTDDAVKRMAEIYQKDRPAGENARAVLINEGQLALNQPGIWIAGNAPTGNSPPQVVRGELTHNVIAWPVGSGELHPPQGFSPVVSRGQSVIIASRDQPCRQIWIDADLAAWEQTSDFVIFFANALDWIAQSDARYVSISPAELGDAYQSTANPREPAGLGPGEWPGIYRSQTDGRSVAVNAGALPPAVKGTAGFEGKMNRKALGAVSVQRWVVFAALACLIAAALLLQSRSML